MIWTLEATESEESWTHEIISAVIEAMPEPLPPRHQKIGSSIAEWFEATPGVAVILSKGGSIDDRTFAEQIVKYQLEPHGYRRAQFNIDAGIPDYPPVPESDESHDTVMCPQCGELLSHHSMDFEQGRETRRCKTCGFEDQRGLPGSSNDPLERLYRDSASRTSKWPDIMAKAKRLIQSNQVTLLRNGYNNIVAHVIGDHGEYNTEIGRDDPDSQSITTWQCECNDPHNRVVMGDGTTKFAKDIQTGDLVMTATGRTGIVGRTMSRDYDGRMMGLKIEGTTETVWLTDNHKLITADVEAKEARDWKTGDFSYMPQPHYAEQYEIDVSYYLPELVEQDSRLYRRNKSYGSAKQRKGPWTTSVISTSQKPIPAQILIDENFARLAGLYLAEGIATPKGELRWSFNENEEHLADEVIERLKVYGLDNAKKKLARHCLTVAVQSKPLSELFKALFGTGSRDKKLNSQMMAMNQEALEAFFNAWVEGDGCTTHQYRHYLGTASDDLAMQARLIMARLGRESVVRRIEKNASELVPNGGSFNQIAWRANGGEGQGVRWFDQDQVTQRMVVEEKRYTGKVYNFEVIGEHTYVLAPGIASLNCPWDQYAWQRTRKWKKYEGRPCAHVLAAYWKSKSTPLDDYNPNEHGPMPGQRMAPSPEGGGKTSPLQGDIPQAPQPPGAPQGPPGLHGQPDAVGGPPSPAQAPLAPPQPPGVLPPSPMEQLQMMQPPMPGSTPGGQPAPPGSVSVPGARLPSPFNPIQYPGGTYSRTAAEFNPPEIVRLTQDIYGVAEGRSEAHGAGQYVNVPAVKTDGTPQTAEVLGQDETTGWVEIIVPLDDAGALEPELVRCYVEPADIEHSRQRPPGPFIRRRR